MRCSHPHCRTSLDDGGVRCPHDLPFCEHCTWEEACDECAYESTVTAQLFALHAAKDQTVDAADLDVELGDLKPMVDVWDPPTIAPTVGDVALVPSSPDDRACAGCHKPVSYGRPAALHYTAGRASTIFAAYHPECWRRYEREAS